MTELGWASVKRRACPHPRPLRVQRQIATEPEPVWAEVCGRCGHVVDPTRKAAGRRVNNLAKDIERWVCRALGITRVGQFGAKADGGTSSEWATVSIKSGPQWFLPRFWSEIEALPRVTGQRRALVVVEKPGPGKPRRAMWVEFIDEVQRPVV